MVFRISKLIAAAGAVVGLSACAQGPGGPQEAGLAAAPSQAAPVACSDFGLVDRDANGIITQAEWGGFGDAAFGDWDINNEYRISRSEFETCWRAGGFRNDAAFEEDDWGVNFAAFDDDDDEFLDEDEFFGDEGFGLFDENDDSGLGLDEWGV